MKRKWIIENLDIMCSPRLTDITTRTYEEQRINQIDKSPCIPEF